MVVESPLTQRANFSSHLTEPQRQRVSLVGRDTQPPLRAAIISMRLAESVCRQFDIETYEVAGNRAVVHIDIKVSGVVHRTMLRHPGSDRPVVPRGVLDQVVRVAGGDAVMICDLDHVAEMTPRLRRRIELDFPEPGSAEGLCD